ncbi:tape measure protein [Gordonia tangerina]|uniref:Tape measure protein n=1 Tax=Gordonia tangerina TaxID=2911060 RepID=A0ABS9DRT9_9ACTN|nr:tape measure protein [Gordonia tangerina]MCF3941317.1 tape measure protein [Gordonia tangerina]
MAQELAVGYLSLVVEASQVPRAVRQALGQADRDAERTGRSMGNKMAGALGTALKGGAVAAAAAGGAAIGTALYKGFDRLSAIDQAKGKLAGLGNSAQTTATVMDSALASVKGTAFGLGDAATIAASAIAAGIKPGQDLTKYLSMTADAASIAGVSLSDMGAILNQVQTGQQAYTDDLNQLADRGIPIYQWLGQEMNVAAKEVKGLAADGKVSSEVLFRAIQKNIGGAAQESGKTVKGSFENLIAALGRFGAAIETPTFNRLPGFFGDLTDRIDTLTPRAEAMAQAFDAKVFDEWVPKIREALDAFKESGQLDRMREVFAGLGRELGQLGPSVGRIAAALAQASAALGVSGWQLLLTALQAGTAALDALNPLLSTTASLMESNQAAVTALLGAWLAFKTVPSLLGKAASALAPIATSARTASEAMSGFGDAYRQSVQWMQQSNPTASGAGRILFGMGSQAQTASTHLRVLGSNASALARGGITSLTNAGTGLVNVMGGPLNAALVGAGIVLATVASKTADARQKQEEYESSIKRAAEAQAALNAELLKSRGAVTDDVVTAQTDVLSQYEEQLKATEDRHKSWFDKVFSFSGSFDKSGTDAINDAATKATEARRALDELDMTNEEVSRQISGSAGAYDTLRTRLAGMGSDGQQAAEGLDLMRQKFLDQQDLARRLAPGVTELGEAVRIMGDDSASASDKLSALKSAMDALSPARSKTEAIAQHAEAIRKVADAAQGIGADAFKGGVLDPRTESGATLSRNLQAIADKSAEIASSGDMKAIGDAAKANEVAFQQLAVATGQPIEKIRELYDELGGGAVDLTVDLKGDTEVAQQLAQIKYLWNEQPEKKTLTVESSSVTKDTEAALDRLDFSVKRLPDGKSVEITARSEEAQQRLNSVFQAVTKLPNGKPINVSAPGGNEVRDLLSSLGAKVKTDNNKNIEVTSPLAPGVLELLKQIGLQVETRNGKQIIVTANDSDYNNKQGKWTRTETKYIDIITREGAAAFNPGNGIVAGPPAADGWIRKYAHGGIHALEKYANGGSLTDAKMLPGRGAGSLYSTPAGPAIAAEGETVAEAFIPMAKAKRRRSTDILAVVAKAFGYELIPKDNLPGSVSELLGAVSGGAISRLLAPTGINRIGKFADGGIVTGDQLRALAEGRGASQPLTGAPYVWGGVNWGDCCLIAETPVWGPDGVTPIADLQPGQRVWSYVDGKLEAHRVTAAWFSKTQETFTVRTRQRAVTGSANHPFLRLVETVPARPRVGRRGWEPAEYDVEWARLDELAAGDLLVQPKAVRLEHAQSNTLPSGRPIGLLEAWLLGVILGDGNVSDTKVEICVYGDLRDRVRDILGRMRIGASRTRGERDGITTSDSEAHGIRAYSTEFARELIEAGFRKPAHEKRIPECVWGWDDERKRAFLNGYCDADGHHPADVARHGERTYSSSSRALIEDVRYLHVILGDGVANVSTNMRRKPIVINGAEVKLARPLHTICVRLGEGVIGSVAAARRPGVASWIDTSEFTVAPILSIEDGDVVDTYDITVEGAHNFIAGGVVVHNSGAMSAFARLAAGLNPFGGRFSTATMGDYLVKLGAKLGRGPAGTMRFGWVNGGPGGGHTAGTLPDGSNVEMGGSYGGGKLGGSVGADDPQFTDHAYMVVKNSNKYAAPGESSYEDSIASGSSLPDSALSGGYTFDPITAETDDSGDKSLSGRLGNAASAFVTGQVGSLFDLLSVNNNPGWLAAITEYERAHKEDARKNYEAEKRKLDQDYQDAEAQRKSDYDAAKEMIDSDYQSSIISADERDRRMLALRNQFEQDETAKRHDYENSVIQKGQQYGLVDGDSVSSLSLKQQYESDQLRGAQQLQSAEYEREAQYNRDKLALDNLKQSHSITQAEYDRRLRDAKAKYDSDVRGLKDNYSTSQEQLKANFDRSQTLYAPSDRYLPNTITTTQFRPTDPGTVKPAEYEDLNTAGATKNTGAGGVKDAVKSAFADRKWDEGAQWSATDYIVDHESGWNPLAVNPQSGAFGLFQFLGETQRQYLPDRNTDPAVQGQAGKRYIGDRYGDPVNARAFWEKNHWYDQGGIADGIGFMQKNILKPERVLSPNETEAFQDGVRNGFSGNSDQIVAKLDQLIELMAKTPRGQVNYNFPADRGVERAQRVAESRKRAGLAAY